MTKETESMMLYGWSLNFFSKSQLKEMSIKLSGDSEDAFDDDVEEELVEYIAIWSGLNYYKHINYYNCINYFIGFYILQGTNPDKISSNFKKQMQKAMKLFKKHKIKLGEPLLYCIDSI